MKYINVYTCFGLLIGCSVALANCTAKQAADSVACATTVQTAIATPPGMTDAQKGVAAGIAAASSPACIGLSADAVAAMAQLKTATPNTTAVPAPK